MSATAATGAPFREFSTCIPIYRGYPPPVYGGTKGGTGGLRGGLKAHFTSCFALSFYMNHQELGFTLLARCQVALDPDLIGTEGFSRTCPDP